jgi:2-polyprenyl-3-methyl-5-hydroxy-6-metoxy-1,4-benzoquinol methylase
MKSENLSAREYWNQRPDFRDYYLKPTLFDRIFRRAVFLRAAAAVDVCTHYTEPAVLDVGCGPGVNSVAMVRKGGARHVLGIDFAPAMIEQAREYAEQNSAESSCTFVEGDFMTQQFDERFQVVAALGVFDYVQDALAFLTRMREVGNGTVVASWPQDGLRMALRRRRYTCPLFSYGPADITAIHRDAGLEQLELIKVPGGHVSVALAPS